MEGSDVYRHGDYATHIPEVRRVSYRRAWVIYALLHTTTCMFIDPCKFKTSGL